MKVKKYLAVKKNGQTRIVANKPSLMPNEIAIQLNIEVPDQLFTKPTLVADITIDESVAMEELISTEVIDNAKQIISDGLGLEIHVRTVEEE